MSPIPPFDSGLDRLVYDAEAYLRSSLDGYDWKTREKRVKGLAKRFQLAWDNADHVFEQLYKLGVLEADYGFYRVKRPTSSQSG